MSSSQEGQRESRPLVEPPFRTEVPPEADTIGLRPRVLSRRAMGVLISLSFASAVCLSMVLARRLYVGHANLYIVWNLLLAWIPPIFAFAVYRFHLYRTRRYVLLVFCALTWFFFFPNAPYIITDFVHLDFNRPDKVMWIDLFTIASFAWTGLCLGYVSLCLMQEVVRARLGRVVGWLFVLTMLALGSLGIYMGRCLRWNSWDVLRHPLELFSHGLADEVPFVQPEMKVFLVMMFLFLLLSYGTLYSLAHLHGRRVD